MGDGGRLFIDQFGSIIFRRTDHHFFCHLVGLAANGGVEHQNRVIVRRVRQHGRLALEHEAGLDEIGLDHRRIDTAMLRSRGAPPWRIVGLAVIEALMLVVPAARALTGDAWTALLSHAAAGVALLSSDGEELSIGQIMLMSKQALTRRVLEDRRIDIYSCGRADIRAARSLSERGRSGSATARSPNARTTSSAR